MTTDKTYNGWSNRETWLVNLWLTNDEHTYHNARGLNATHLEPFVLDLVESTHVDGFMADLIDAALARVDWNEIAISLSE